MNRSLYTKLVFIMLLLIVSLMSVAGVFLMRGVRSFYLEDFYQQMQSVFNNKNELSEGLRKAAAAAGEDGTLESRAADMMDVLSGYIGQLGIDSRSRNYYILNGNTGAVLDGSDIPEEGLPVTPNILTAINGENGYGYDSSADYMDVALPVFSGTPGNEASDYIVYIKDNKQTVQNLNSELFRIILEALVVGLVISLLLSMILAKTMVTPIQSLTRAAERVASGDFSRKPKNDAKDEIGVLTRTFNDMAEQLETTLDNLRRSERMRREFVANVSHELRTPITSVRSYAETLEDSEGLSRDTEKEFLRVIVNESDRMKNIVQDLLTLSRFDAGSFEFKFERFSFESSVREVYSAMLLEAQNHHHEFSIEFKTEMPTIIGDPSRVEQVLINMISNAIKYTQDSGRIRITAGADEETVWVSVRDNGVGIPKEDVDRVFERFYRVDKARSRESGGTGLGLSIAQEIVRRHSGKIELQSRQGIGTVITMTLPIDGPVHTAEVRDE